jgi:hypothetical protein
MQPGQAQFNVIVNVTGVVAVYVGSKHLCLTHFPQKRVTCYRFVADCVTG